MWDIAPRRARDSRKYLQHGIAGASSDIEGVEFAAGLLVFQRRYVSPRQIIHVDIVAEA